jgi:hypothetical protein
MKVQVWALVAAAFGGFIAVVYALSGAVGIGAGFAAATAVGLATQLRPEDRRGIAGGRVRNEAKIAAFKAVSIAFGLACVFGFLVRAAFDHWGRSQTGLVAILALTGLEATLFIELRRQADDFLNRLRGQSEKRPFATSSTRCAMKDGSSFTTGIARTAATSTTSSSERRVLLQSKQNQAVIEARPAGKRLGRLLAVREAGDISREKIEKALAATQQWLGVEEAPDRWLGELYQSANRLAHLYWLRKVARVEAWLVHLLFTDDYTHRGASREEWDRDLPLIDRELGLVSQSEWASHAYLPALAPEELTRLAERAVPATP